MLDAIVVVAVIILILLAAVLVYAAARPNTFRVQRTARIQAPPETIYALITDFHRWRAWSPYEARDPAMQRTFSGAPSGLGAAYAWEGNKNIGAGHMQIIEASAPSRVLIDLNFLRPFKARNVAEFTIEPRGDASEVTWAMYGPNLFVGKVMGLFINMDRMIGRDFEQGLANLKAAAEK
jgi:hypothetical protein